ncbi:MAG: hypothetical protein ACXV3U_04460 [Halobacteriota archaeon]
MVDTHSIGNKGTNHPQRCPSEDEYKVPPSFPPLLQGYTDIIQQIYRLPDLVIWFPLTRTSGSIGNRVKVPIFPLLLSKILAKHHIRQQLLYLIKYFNLRLACLDADHECEFSKSKRSARKKELDRAKNDAENVLDTLPPGRINKWWVFTGLVLVLFAIVYFTPLQPPQREIVVEFFTGVTKLDLQVTVNSMTSPVLLEAGRTILQSLRFPILIASLALIALIWIYGVQRLLLNHPSTQLKDYDVKCWLADAHNNIGVLKLEKETFKCLGVTKPWELQLDVLVYVLYIAPLLLGFGLILGGLFLPTGSTALSDAAFSLGTKDVLTIEQIALGSALMLASFAALAHGLNHWYLRSLPTPDKKDPKPVLAGTAAALNLLVVGLGHIYVGKVRRGLLFFSLWFLFFFSVTVFDARWYLNFPVLSLSVYTFFFIIITTILVVWAAYDAWKMADKRNHLPSAPIQSDKRSNGDLVDKFLRSLREYDSEFLSWTNALDHPRSWRGAVLVSVALLLSINLFLGQAGFGWKGADPFLQTYMDDFKEGRASWATTVGMQVAEEKTTWKNENNVQIHYKVMNKTIGLGYAYDYKIQRFRSVDQAHRSALELSKGYDLEEKVNYSVGGAYEKVSGQAPQVFLSFVKSDNPNELRRVFQVQDLVVSGTQYVVSEAPQLRT